MKPLRETMIDLWQAACQDKGRRSCRVEDGHFVLEITGNRARWEEMTAAAGMPSQAVENIDGDTLTMRWPSHADAVFGADGLLAQALDKYEVRPQQLWMGRMVQRAIEMGQPAVIEAGAGTGKSFAYAAVCMAMGKKLVIFVHIAETVPGTGMMDLETALLRLQQAQPDGYAVIEHLPVNLIPLAKRNLTDLAKRLGLPIG